MSYHTAPDIEALRLRQFEENVEAYKIDLDFCHGVLTNPNLTPAEERTWQLRILDVSHRIRYCTHQVDIIRFEQRARTASPMLPIRYALSSGIQSKGKSVKRAAQSDDQDEGNLPAKRMKFPGKAVTGNPISTPTAASSSSKTPDNEAPNAPEDEIPAHTTDTEEQPAGSRLQRLGHWDCHLCKSTKYMTARTRDPAEPCKWPLRDIYKMIAHYLSKHTEHTRLERCRELGDALEGNLGPFEHWLTAIKKQDIGDGGIVVDIVDKLKNGVVHEMLRSLHKNAAEFPV
jgi:hypothetical protein